MTELLRKQPFFGSLVLRLPLRPDPSRETLATDGHEIRYSPGWIAQTDSHLIETAMVRVVMVCALKHHTRRGERDPETLAVRPRSSSPTRCCAMPASRSSRTPQPGRT